MIEYARLRGIRVMPEFDTPGGFIHCFQFNSQFLSGHTGAWGSGQSGLLTDCYDIFGELTNLPNLIDPSNDANFEFLQTFLEEIFTVFPENYVHLGGDEVTDFILECW